MSTEPENNPSTPPASDPPSLLGGQQPAPNADPATPPAGDPSPPPEPVAPLTLEAIKFPEGFTVDQKATEDFLGVMNDDKLSPAERAQKLVDLQSGVMQQMAQAQEAEWAKMQNDWQDEVRKDPEIGGEKLAPVLGEISKLVDQYGSPELRQVMNLTGAGNNPHVVRFLHNIAKDLGEGRPVSGAPAQPKETLADRMYPSMKKQGA